MCRRRLVLAQGLVVGFQALALAQGICGDETCEPAVGETRENCPSDCFTVGGLVLQDLSDPFYGGLDGVTVFIEGINGTPDTAQTVTTGVATGLAGLWSVDVSEGQYRIRWMLEGYCFWQVNVVGLQFSQGEATPVVIDVNSSNATINGSVVSYAAMSTEVCAAQPCSMDDQCDDNDPCTTDSCVEDICHSASGAECNQAICADQSQPLCNECAAGCDGCGSCQDCKVELCEMVSYACQWRQGCNDDLNCMTRSAFLWRNGECYCYDPSLGNWFPSECDSSCVCEEQSAPTVQRESNSHHQLTMLRSRAHGHGSAAHFRIDIQIDLESNATAWAVEEVIPLGAVVVDISAQGVWDQRQQKVKWGPFFDADLDTLSYTLLASAGDINAGEFFGRVARDGMVESQVGDRTITRVRQRARATAREHRVVQTEEMQEADR